jgi:hypothetical protein
MSAFHSTVWLSALMAAQSQCRVESRAVTRMQLVVVDRIAAGDMVMGVRYVQCKSWLMAKGHDIPKGDHMSRETVATCDGVVSEGCQYS